MQVERRGLAWYTKQERRQPVSLIVAASAGRAEIYSDSERQAPWDGVSRRRRLPQLCAAAPDKSDGGPRRVQASRSEWFHRPGGGGPMSGGAGQFGGSVLFTSQGLGASAALGRRFNAQIWLHVGQAFAFRLPPGNSIRRPPDHA